MTGERLSAQRFAQILAGWESDNRQAVLTSFGGEILTALRELAERRAADEKPAAQSPIARVTVPDAGPAQVMLYAPGLPPGEHDLYCEPADEKTAGWHSLEDLWPPEEFKYVLAYRPGVEKAYSLAQWWTHASGRRMWELNGVSGHGVPAPTHWMHLPPPPRTTVETTACQCDGFILHDNTCKKCGKPVQI